MRSWLPLLLTSSLGCVSVPSPARSFHAPPGEVRAAALAAVAGHDGVREEDGRILTGWSAEEPGGPQSTLLGYGYVYRRRHEIRLDGSAVAVTTDLERRAAGGVRSRRWERVDGTPAAEALLAEIGRRLEKTP
ncbi:MAG TPA: hypothetical protein VEJ18_12590 [Planctomycetota bacterium]|nr:hypothetical protein [Planctomycetota bacterium]